MALPRPRPVPSGSCVRWPAGQGWSDGGLGVLQEDREVPQELADAADRVLGLPGGLAVDADREGVAHHEQLAAAGVVRVAGPAGGETELAGGLDRVGCVAHDERLVLGLQEVGVHAEQLGEDLGTAAAVDGDQLDALEADGHEGLDDEAVGVRRLGGKALVLTRVGADQLVLGGGHGARAHGQQDAADGLGVEAEGELHTAQHPVGHAARPHDRVDLLRCGHRGVAERPVERGHGAGALQPRRGELERVRSQLLLGELDVVLERLVGRDAVDHGAQGGGGRDGREFELELGGDLGEYFTTQGVDDRRVLLYGLEAVAAETHDGFPFVGTRLFA